MQNTTEIPEHTPETSTPRLLRGLRWLDELHPVVVLSTGMGLIVCIGGFGYLTGPLLSISLLYLIPLLLITRSAGLRAGILSSLLAALLWLATDLRASFDFTHPVTPYWNVLMRLGTFLVAVGLVSATKSLNAHLEERVRERTAALESQIEETRELEKAILEISDRERAAVGQDLHDGLCQHLVGAAFTANMLRGKITSDPATCARDVECISDLIDESITQARNLARGLYPVQLETEGLEMAIRELASSMSQRHDLSCEVECPSPLPTLKEGVGIHLYRIIQEAVTNAAKHSGAGKVVIHLGLIEEGLCASVSDAGVGVDQAGRNPVGMGLNIMEYRARMIGADFRIQTRTGGGTLVTCRVGILNVEC